MSKELLLLKETAVGWDTVLVSYDPNTKYKFFEIYMVKFEIVVAKLHLKFNHISLKYILHLRYSFCFVRMAKLCLSLTHDIYSLLHNKATYFSILSLFHRIKDKFFLVVTARKTMP